MIQEISQNTFIAFDGDKKILFHVDAETYNNYGGNKTRELTKGTGLPLVFEHIYDGVKKTYTLSHSITVLGVPIFFIENIVVGNIDNEARVIVDETVLTC